MRPDLAKLGSRHVCFKCGTKFYDLNRMPNLCPKCNVDQAENPSPDPREAVMSRIKASAKSAPRKAEDLDEDVDVDEDAFDLDEDVDLDDDDDVDLDDDEEEAEIEEEGE